MRMGEASNQGVDKVQQGMDQAANDVQHCELVIYYRAQSNGG